MVGVAILIHSKTSRKIQPFKAGRDAFGLAFTTFLNARSNFLPVSSAPSSLAASMKRADWSAVFFDSMPDTGFQEFALAISGRLLFEFSPVRA